MDSKWRGFCGVFTLAASLAVLGCGSDGNSYVRAVNASQGLSNFTIQVGQTGIVSGLAFGQEGVQPQGQYSTLDTSGNYRAVGAGSNQTLSIYETPGTILASTKQTFLKNTSYTIVTLSQAASVEFATLTDDDSAPTGGSYSLRVMDTSTQAGAVDVYITTVGAGVGGSPTVGNMQFQQVTTPYLQESPGTLEVQVTRHGSNTALATELFNPAAGKIYSVFFLDPPNGSAPIVPPSIPAVPGANTYGVLIVNDPVSGGSK